MTRQQTQRLATVLINLLALLVFVPVILVIGYVILSGIGAINWEFLTAMPTNGMTEGGIMPAIVGTLILTIGTAIVSIPFSIAAAIYLSEYARDTRLTRTIRMAIVNLAGIPSIVYGLFGLGAFVLGAQFGTSILAGSLTLGIMTMPVVISTSEEATGCHSAALSHRQPESGRQQVANHSSPGAARTRCPAFSPA